MYSGQLKGFPREVVEWMLDQQENQGNKRDVSVFEDCLFTSVISKGFSWVDTKENKRFCEDVIIGRDFDLFFKMHPKKSQYPKVMWVSHYLDGLEIPERRYQRVVLMEKNGKFLYWANAKTLEDAEKETEVICCSYAKDIEEEPQIVELTMEDISDGKGVGLDARFIRIIK